MNSIVQLTNQDDSSASGLGIQIGIKQQGTYAPFLKEAVIKPNLEQMPSVLPQFISKTGQLTFPLAARLIQTSPLVLGGDVNALISYRIDYY